jgi:hypothetical protein
VFSLTVVLLLGDSRDRLKPTLSYQSKQVNRTRTGVSTAKADSRSSTGVSLAVALESLLSLLSLLEGYSLETGY